MRVVQNPDGTVSIVNEDEKPDGYIEEIIVDSVSSVLSLK
jgi:hypothetical protein